MPHELLLYNAGFRAGRTRLAASSNLRSFKLNRDQKFFDMYSLVIGGLAAVALVILVIALRISDVKQGEFTRDSVEYQRAVNDRIRPVGGVYMPGEADDAEAPVVQAAAEPEPVAAEMTGPQVYNDACIACHGNGVGGAPIVGNLEQWDYRIDKGIDVLYDHAINGFQGEQGIMIAKGGRMDLSDEAVRRAVDYMVEESQ